MSLYLKCLASLGQFSCERAVQFEAFDGKRLSLFVQADEVSMILGRATNDPSPALLEVRELRRRDDLILISLPAEILGNGGRTATVRDRATYREKLAT